MKRSYDVSCCVFKKQKVIPVVPVVPMESPNDIIKTLEENYPDIYERKSKVNELIQNGNTSVELKGYAEKLHDQIVMNPTQQWMR